MNVSHNIFTRIIVLILYLTTSVIGRMLVSIYYALRYSVVKSYFLLK